MYIWIWLIVVAQFINAIVALVDKYIVTKPGLPKPVVYAFYVNLLSAGALVVLLVGEVVAPIVPYHESFSLPRLSELTVPSFWLVVVSLVSGFVVLQALIALFKAFRQADASDVVPMVSALTAIFSYIISHFVFGNVFSQNFIIAFGFLVVGTALISHFRVTRRILVLALTAGFLFALHSVILKYIFNNANFSDGFFWTRLAGVVSALSLLLFRSTRSRIFNQTKDGSKSSGLWVIGNKTLAGIAGILILTAINVGDIALINALNGLQFVFLLLFTAILGRRTTKHIGEEVSHKELVQKFVAIVLVAIGFFVLFI